MPKPYQRTTVDQHCALWSMFVGINQYSDPVWAPLRFAEADATSLAELFQDPTRCGYSAGSVELFVDSAAELTLRPTFGNIIAGIERLSRAASVDDLILFGFFGHGMDIDGDSYIFPSDSHVSQAKKTALPLEWIRARLDSSPARAKVLVFDACHTGKLRTDDLMPRSGVDSFGRTIDDLVKSRGWAVLTACARNEQSWELPDKGHGVYTYYLTEALCGAADSDHDGVITVHDASQYASIKTKRWAAEHRASQNPELYQNTNGDIPLIIRRQSSKEIPIIAVMGTKGGVGKGTVITGIAQLMAELSSDVAVIDFDIETCGSTHEAATLFSERNHGVATVLDYLAPYAEGFKTTARKGDDLWDITPEHLRSHKRGNIWLLPAADLDRDQKRFEAVANIPPNVKIDTKMMSREELLLSITQEIIRRVIAKVPSLRCILIDCGAGRNPIYYAAFAVADYRYIVTLPDASYFGEIAGIKTELQSLFPRSALRITHTIVNRVTGREDQARTEALHPVTMIPLDPLAEHDRFAGGSIDYDLGYNEIFLALRAGLEKTIGSAYPDLVPDEYDVRIKPWWSRLVESQLARRSLQSREFRRKTTVLRSLAAVLILLVLITASRLWTGTDVLPVLVVLVIALLWSLAYLTPHELRRRLLQRIAALNPKSGIDSGEFGRMLMSQPDRADLRWLRELVKADLRKEKQRRQSRQKSTA